jgi:hypothetical protein
VVAFSDFPKPARPDIFERRAPAVPGGSSSVRAESDLVARRARQHFLLQPEGGRVSLLGEQRDGWVEVLVRDDGPGISSESRSRSSTPSCRSIAA